MAEHLIKNKYTLWDNGTLVYLKVESELKLNLLLDEIKRFNNEYAYFREPDIGDELTSISCLGNSYLFKKLRLL